MLVDTGIVLVHGDVGSGKTAFMVRYEVCLTFPLGNWQFSHALSHVTMLGKAGPRTDGVYTFREQRL